MATFTTGVSGDTGNVRGAPFNDFSTFDLLVNGALGDDDDNPDLRNGFIRFPITGIAQGSTLLSASLDLYATATANAQSNSFRIRAGLVDTPIAPTTYANYFTPTRTTAQTSVTVSSGNPTASTLYNYDVTSVVQELVNRATWDESAIVFYLEYTNTSTPGGQHVEYSRHGEATPPSLTIELGGGSCYRGLARYLVRPFCKQLLKCCTAP